MRPALLLAALAVSVPLTASAAEAPKIAHAWARPTLGAAAASAVYLEITGGARPDRLTGASTPAAARLELHRSTMEGGVMTMAPQSAVDVPAGGAVKLAPGGLHLMLMGAKRPLRAGDRLPVTLRFARAGAVRVTAEVRATPPK